MMIKCAHCKREEPKDPAGFLGMYPSGWHPVSPTGNFTIYPVCTDCVLELETLMADISKFYGRLSDGK